MSKNNTKNETNFRKLLKKIEDIVANTTKEDIQKAINEVKEI